MNYGSWTLTSFSLDNYAAEVLSVSNSHVVMAKRCMNCVCRKKIAPKLYVVESLPGGMVHGCHWKIFEVNTRTCATLFNTILIIMEIDPVVIIFPTESENLWENYIRLGLCMVMYATPISWWYQCDQHCTACVDGGFIIAQHDIDMLDYIWTL